MSRSTESASWCTKVVLSGVLAGGSLALVGVGTAAAGGPDPLAPVTYTDSTVPVGYTVPAGVCSITVNAVGAQGGDGVGSPAPVGGRGGQVVSELAVSPGQQAEIFVGGQGSLSEQPTLVRASAHRGAANDLRRWLDRRGVHPDTQPPASSGLSGGEPTGGPGGLGNIRSGGGGGGSFIFLDTMNYPVIVAAGGGGAAGTDPGSVTGGAGGAGGATGAAGMDGAGSVDTGGNVRSPADPAWDGKGGRGATGTAAGGGGDAGTNSQAGGTGTQPDGGVGGGQFYNGEQYIFASGTGGGGGAGIWGGGGGGAAQSNYPAEAAGGGGGGGSNLAPAGSSINGVTTRTGDGAVTVTPHATCPPSAVQRISATAGNANARVTWTAPTDLGGAPITGYTITAYINGVAKKTVTSPGAGLAATVPGLINGTHYTFTVAAINSAGTGADSVHSNVVRPMGPPRPPAPPAPPFVLQSQTLWGHVEIAAHNTRFAFEVTFNQTRPSLEVTLTSRATGKLLAATTIHPATASRRFTGVLAFPTSAIGTWGAYTYTLTTGAPTSTFVFRSDVRKHSTLALGATRAHGVVTVTGAAKVLDTTSNAYVAWAHRPVDIQQRTGTGWVTIATATTDGRGHLSRVVHLPAGTSLRLVDADTATQFGRVSNIRKV